MDNQPDRALDVEVKEEARSHEERVKELVQDLRKLITDGDTSSAVPLFGQLHPVDQGEFLVELAREPRQELLATLSPDRTAEILEHLEPEEAVSLCDCLEIPTLAHVLDEVSPDVAADILKQLPREHVEQALQVMEEAQEVIPLLQYRDDTAGGVMIPDYPVVKENITTGNALDQLRILGPDAEDISTVFVVDEESKLVGSLSVTRLALARPTSMVGDIADREVISVSAELDQEESARLMQRYNLNQLPVVDQDRRLIGVILAEDMVDVVEAEATEDMYRIAGVPGERVFGPLRNSLRRRLPWLYLNLATAFMAASAVSIFESTIARMAALAVFLPVVAGQGGIGGTQTVTLVVRSMALGEIPANVGLRLLSRELSLGLVNGVLLGVVVGFVAYAWKGNPMLGVVLGLAMLGNMLVAGMAGAGVPLLLRRFRLDPAVSSAIFVTTFTDVIGFLLFLGLAAVFINFLL